MLKPGICQKCDKKKHFNGSLKIPNLSFYFGKWNMYGRIRSQRVNEDM